MFGFGSSMQMEGRVAVVTGGAMGMGLELSLLLAKAGCSVAMCDVNEPALDAARSQCDAVKSRRESLTPRTQSPEAFPQTP